MRLAIDHRLTLTLPQGYSQAVFHLLLTPSNGPTQSVESWSIDMPGIGNAGRFADGFGNIAHLVNQSLPDGELVIEVRGIVTTRDTHGVIGRPAGEPVPALYRRATTLAKAPSGIVAKFRNARENRLDTLHALMARVGELPGTAENKPAQTQMQADGGLVQSQSTELKPSTLSSDLAHAFIGAARALEIPARYVIGYRVADGEASSPHAWAEAFDERLGWIGFDPTHQLCPTDDYVRLAAGLDAETALPVRTVPAIDVSQHIRVAEEAAT